MSKESEAYRLQMLRNLKQKYGKAKPSEVLEAEKVIAKYREEETHDREAMTRLNNPLPEPNLCPQCFYFRGRSIKMDPTSPTDRSKYDRWRCSYCDFVLDVQFRS